MPKTKSIPSALIAQVKESDRKRFEQDYYEANFVLDIMRAAIEKKIASLETKEEDEKLFQEPGYVEHLVSIIGQRKMAKELLNLFPKKG